MTIKELRVFVNKNFLIWNQVRPTWVFDEIQKHIFLPNLNMRITKITFKNEHDKYIWSLFFEIIIKHENFICFNIYRAKVNITAFFKKLNENSEIPVIPFMNILKLILLIIKMNMGPLGWVFH